MRIAVIGGSGFIGSYVVAQLLEEGHEVINFDVMAPARPDVRHIYVDVTNFAQMSIVMAGDWDCIYLLAAVANVDHFYLNPVEAYHVNMMSVINTLEVARRYKVPRVVYASTIWIYDLSEELEVDESTPLLGQRVNHLYTVTKVAGEMTLAASSKLYQQGYTILRFGIPYGPGARSGTVITEFVRRAANGIPLTIHGDGSQYRNFVHVKDLARGCVRALQPQALNQIYNLEGATRVPIREIADIVSEAYPGTQVEYREARPGDFRGKSISREKARQELGWEPQIDFRDGLLDYIRWYREREALAGNVQR